jgi:hypothetical protein
MTDHSAELDRLGYATVSRDHLSRLVAASLASQTAHVIDVTVSPVDYPTFSIATGALMRVAGLAQVANGDTQPFRIFVKLLQSARAWPLIHVVPEEHRETWSTSFPWRIEIDAFTSPLAQILPDQMRLADLYEVVEIYPDRAAMWMEDIDADMGPWPLDRYRRAAYNLGQLAGRRPPDTDTKLGALLENHVPGLALKMYVAGRLEQGMIPLLGRDDRWNHPSLIAALAETNEGTLRAELNGAAAHLVPWLTSMDELPQTYVHGDASPQNLLVPRESPDTFVVIDWGFNSPQCVGFDLGQLLLGHVNSGTTAPAMLTAIHEVIEPAYCEGLNSAGFGATPAEVHQGYFMSLAVRSLFATLPLDELDAPDSAELRARLRTRIAMTRFLLNLTKEIR